MTASLGQPRWWLKALLDLLDSRGDFYKDLINCVCNGHDTKHGLSGNRSNNKVFVMCLFVVASGPVPMMQSWPSI